MIEPALHTIYDSNWYFVYRSQEFYQTVQILGQELYLASRGEDERL